MCIAIECSYKLDQKNEFKFLCELCTFSQIRSHIMTPHIHDMNICNSYNMGTRDLPDIYAQAYEGAGIYIRKIPSAHVITNIFHLRHSKNLPKVDLNISASLYSNGYSL